MRSTILQIEDRASGYAVGPIPPQPERPDLLGYFAEHRAAVRWAKFTATAKGWRVVDQSEAGQ